jgi:bifunctional ADP-heptose synthase (sugar kinase/adenylyltransferase)
VLALVGPERAMGQAFLALQGATDFALKVTIQQRERVLFRTPVRSVVRLDREPAGDPSPASEGAMLARLEALAPPVDAFLLSDYGYGTVTPRVLERVRALARGTDTSVTADSRYDLPRFTGLTAATPNEAEPSRRWPSTVDNADQAKVYVPFSSSGTAALTWRSSASL